MPLLLVHDRGEGHAEELGVDVEDRLSHPAVFEIRTDLLRVETEALRLHAVEVVLPLPLADRRRAGLIEALLLEKHRDLGLGRIGDASSSSAKNRSSASGVRTMRSSTL